METKVCQCCNKPLPFDPLYFEIDLDQPDRLSKNCRQCETIWIRERKVDIFNVFLTKVTGS
jgi:hypothetical protein